MQLLLALACAAAAVAQAPIPDRVAALLAALPLETKLWQLQRPSFSPSLYDTGVGLLEFNAVVAGARNACDVASRRNAMVASFLSTGPGAAFGLIPAFRTLATHGGEAFGTTFPQGPALGATWDVDLVAATSRAMAFESRALGITLVTFVINLWSDARFGRQEEGFSEEPTLTAAMAAACVRGAHKSGDLDPEAYLDPDAAAALFKHAAAYVGSGGLNGGAAPYDEHTVRDVYLKPWRRAAALQARGVMPSHNTILGVPAHGSAWLLSTVLRGEYGMNASLFLSDTGDVSALQAFRTCTDAASCAARALNAGVDVEQAPGATFLNLTAALEGGLVNMSTIDAAVARVLTHKFSAGLFDTPYVNETACEVVNSPAHRALALTAAEEGCVLLHNAAGVLPLAAGLHVAVIGPNGGCGDSGSGAGTVPPCEAQVDMLGNYAGTGPPALTGIVTVAEALAALPGVASVAFSRGANIDDDNSSFISAAVATASAADVIVAVLGDSLSSCGESKDRDSLDLPGGQQALLYALAALAKPLVVVLINCRTVTFDAAAGNALLTNVSALLVAWRPGQEGGTAIANVLTGIAEPGGRLPNSWVRSAAHVGSGASPWLQQRVALYGAPCGGVEDRCYSGYVQATNPATPLWYFGSGMGYTTWSMTNLAVRSQLPGNESFPLVATLQVTNTGTRNGSTVVQVYVQDPVGIGMIVRPWKRLLAFQRVALAPGVGALVTIPVLADDLAYYGDDMQLAVQGGVYVISVGNSSVTDDMVATINVTQTVPQHVARRWRG